MSPSPFAFPLRCSRACLLQPHPEIANDIKVDVATTKRPAVTTFAARTVS
eukprot:SAG25_NODE_5571_length_643_cov_1.136029_2_plen_49_part_01